jgi:xanthine/CO dehydrogenase XdhC/CoxF family maturation factor
MTTAFAKLRLATPDDALPLAALARRAMAAKFEHLYDPADFAAFMEEAHSDATTARQLADPGMRIAVIEEEARWSRSANSCSTARCRANSARPPAR